MLYFVCDFRALLDTSLPFLAIDLRSHPFVEGKGENEDTYTTKRRVGKFNPRLSELIFINLYYILQEPRYYSNYILISNYILRFLSFNLKTPHFPLNCRTL